MKAPLLLMAQAGFVLLTVIYFALLLSVFHKAIQRTSWPADDKKKIINRIVIFLSIWILFVSLWSGSGIMGNFTIFPFNFLPILAIPLIATVALLFSGKITIILQHISQASLVKLQSFRFFVEILLWILFLAGNVPVQMTFEGRNFDIVAGITAPLVAWLMVRGKISKPVLVIWNIACLALLINIVTIAILSTPSPWRVFMNEPANTIVGRFPVSWLPGMLVPLAYALHLLVLKQQWLRK
jgi:hypothetical protein